MKYLKNIITIFIILIIITFLAGSLAYFDKISDTSVLIIQEVTLYIYLFIINYLNGKKQQKNGYLEGLKLGSIIALLFLLIHLLLNKSIDLKYIIYYLTIIFVSMIGSILGINKKTKV